MASRTLIVISVSTVAFFMAGRWIMLKTNPELKVGNSEYEDNRIKSIKENQSLDAKLMASTNKQRLKILLNQVQNNNDQDLYKAALSGKVLNSTSQHTTKIPDTDNSIKNNNNEKTIK